MTSIKDFHFPAVGRDGVRRITLALSAALALACAACGGGGPDTTVPKVELAVTVVESSFETTIGQPLRESTPINVSGGNAPYTFTAQGLPSGVSISASTGRLSGTPTAVFATAQVIITVTDKFGSSKASFVTLTVNAAPVATASAPPSPCVVGIACSFTPVTAQFGTRPFTYTAPTLPPGLSINATTGVVSGVVTAVVPSTSYLVRVTDAVGAITTAQFTLAVNPALLVTPTTPDPICTAGVLCTFTPVTVSGNTTAVTYTVSPALTPPLSLNANTGVVSGTPNAVLPQTTYRITVTDAANFTASADFKLTVNGAVNATSVTPNVASTVSIAFGSAFPAGVRPVTGTGGTGTLTYSLIGANPALPAGLQFSQTTGAITGSPTAVSTVRTYTVQVEDTKGSKATATFAMVINPAVVASQNGASANKGCTKDFACGFTPITVTGGTTPLVFALTPSIAGLSINASTGAVSGTPGTQQAATTYKVIATDAVGARDSANFALTVNPPLLMAVAAPTRTCTTSVSCAYVPVTVSGGTPSVNATVAPSLPSGLTATFASGQFTVSGTPVVSSQNTSYTVTAIDGAGAQATAQFQLSVSGPLTVTLAIPTVASTVNIPFATAFPAVAGSVRPVVGSGGTGTLTYTVLPLLPAGLQFNSATGAITGTPTTTIGASNFSITVNDQLGVSASRSFSLTINSALTAVSSNRTCTVGAACTFGLATPSGGTQPYTLTLRSAPALPAGLSVFGDVVTGTPTATLAATTYTVDVKDAANATTTATFTLTVVAGCVVSNRALDFALAGVISASSCNGSYDTYSVLPPNNRVVELRMTSSAFTSLFVQASPEVPVGNGNVYYFNSAGDASGHYLFSGGANWLLYAGANNGGLGAYTFSATTRAEDVESCRNVVIVTSVATNQRLTSNTCSATYTVGVRNYDMFDVYIPGRPCTIEMRATGATGTINDPFLEGWRSDYSSQFVYSDDDGGGIFGTDARIQLANCVSDDGNIIRLRARAFNGIDFGDYALSISVGAAGAGVSTPSTFVCTRDGASTASLLDPRRSVAQTARPSAFGRSTSAAAGAQTPACTATKQPFAISPNKKR
jgi:hypothetical protein